jgi:RNA-splicing ligase RtcB
VVAKKTNPRSKYDPAMCERMVEMGKTGASQKMMWADLGISRRTAEEYKKKYPEFEEALDLALVHSQAYWERLMLANAENKNFNTRMVEIAVRGQFGETYKDNREVKADVKQEVTIDFAGEIQKLINELKI